MKKFSKSLLSIITLSFIITLISCSGENASNQFPEKVIEKNKVIENSDCVKSQKAYDRGFAEGRKIARMQPDSRERESAILELNGVVSALKRNGFHQSAKDFSKGVEAALAKN